MRPRLQRANERNSERDAAKVNLNENVNCVRDSGEEQKGEKAQRKPRRGTT